MRTIGVVTVARSDYGIYLPILKKIQTDPKLKLQLFVTGMHLSPDFGYTVQVIEDDGFQIHERVEMLLASDTPEGIAKSMGLGTIGFAQAFSRSRPDILVVLGDRFEMYTAALAALPFNIPVAHIHGGELTQGAIDDALRHSITKLSHLHFVSTKLYANRVEQMGEEPWRVIISGAPGLDTIKEIELLNRQDFMSKYDIEIDEKAFLLVTFHPVTLELDKTKLQVTELLTALKESGMPIIFTMTNADTNSRLIIKMINKFVEDHTYAQAVGNLGTLGYFSLMGLASAMVGNSSSGIIEAASFKLPVVNVGNRQQGRIRPKNVIDVGYSHEDILEGISRSLSTEHQPNLTGDNPYGDGNAAERIVNKIKNVKLNDDLIKKRFIDLGEAKA